MKRPYYAALTACFALSYSVNAEAQERKWTDAISLRAFVDAYMVYTSHEAGADVSAEGIPDGTDNHRAYIYADGFGLSFAGIDVTARGESLGATLSMRFGPSVVRFFGDNGPLGFDNLTQGYLSWRPVRQLELDLGQFGTIYGAEVAESWQNINYSRGALYFAMQPFWHTGLRVRYAANDTVGVTGLVVNGTNNIFEDNAGPSLGLQLSLSLGAVRASLGWFGTTVPDSHSEETPLFDNFFDLVASAGLGAFSAVLNVNYAREDSGGQGDYVGGSLALAYALSEVFSVGARGEYLTYLDSRCGEGANNDAGFCRNGYDSLFTGTLTLDIKPVRRSASLILRPEARIEKATDDAFLDDSGSATDIWWAVMLGAVVTIP